MMNFWDRFAGESHFASARLLWARSRFLGGFTWVHSEVRLVGIMDDGVAVGYEDYLSFDNPGPPDFTQLPRGYEYPVGFVGVTLSNLTPGGTLTLTNIFHGSHPLTTVWSHGPTPWAAQPHWHEWEAEIAEDELRLSLTDGGSGDLDGVVNGVISTLYASAYRVPPGPRLSLTSHSRGSLEVLQEVEIDGEATFVPAQLPLISSALTWPATATNWYLEYKDNLSPANIWIRPLERPVVQNHHHVLTNNATGQERYFRLRSF